MAEKIDIVITSDKSLQDTVTHAKSIETAIENTYLSWNKMTDPANNAKVIAEMQKLVAESKKYNSEIKTTTQNQKALEKTQADYNKTLSRSNQIQTSYATDLQKLNARIEVLKKNQKLLKVEGKELSASYINNKNNIKLLTAEYRKLEKQKIQDEIHAKTLKNLRGKENLTLEQQRTLLIALKNEYKKLVTQEGKASKSTLRLQSELNHLNKSILKSERAVGVHQRQVGNYPKAFGGMGAMFAGIGAAVTGAVMAIGRIVSATQKYIDMANAQKDAELKLNVVMAQRMNATDAEVQSILDLTSAQQKLGVVGDEVQLAGAQQLATFLDQKDSLETLIPAMNNLIVQQKGMNGTQQDATNIADLFGKAMQGQVGALTRVGITLNDEQKAMLKSNDESVRAAALAQIVTDNVGDMNAQFAATDSGKIQQAKNNLGDMGEEIGAVLLPMMAKFFQMLLKLADRFKAISKNLGFFKSETNNLTVAQQRQQSENDKLVKTLADEKTKIDKLLVVAKNDKRSKDERITAIKQLNAISPEYLGNINLENVNTQATIKTINRYIQALEQKTKAQLAQQGLSDIMGEIFQAEVAMNEAQIKMAMNTDDVYLSQIKYALSLGQNIDDLITSYGQAGDAQGVFAAKNYKMYLTSQQIFQQSIDDLNTEKETYMNTIDGMDVSLGNLTTTTNDLASANNNLGQSSANIDIYAQKVAELNARNTAKELELRQKYKDDSEKIELELLKFKKNSQLELLKFIDDNNLTQHQVDDNLKYLDFTKQLNEKELQLQQQKYNDLYSDYQKYMQKKQLEDDAYILELQANNADETEIEFQKLNAKKELLSDYLKFLQQNANDSNEIERLSLQNQLLDIDNQLDDLSSNLQQKAQENEGILMKVFGMTPDELSQLKSILGEFAGYYVDFLTKKYEAEIEFSQKKRELLQNDIDSEFDYIEKLRGGLDVENQLRDDNYKNTALLTESLIRQSQMRIKAKKDEQRALLAEEQKSAEKLKKLKKAQIYTQFAVDTASAISSLIKFAYANPLNAINPATALIQIATGMTTIVAGFLKAKNSVKQLKEGEVAIKDGKGNVDDVPALLMKGESVITKKGTNRAENFLKGLNKNATADQLMQLLAVDFGQNTLKENNIFINVQAHESQLTNKQLSENINELRQNNLYLHQLLTEFKNKPDYITIPGGYKEITSHSEKVVMYE